MKSTKLLSVVIGLLISLPSFALKESYEDYLKRTLGDMRDMGIFLDVFSYEQPQSGAPLRNYFISNEQIVLNKNNFLMMQNNPLKTSFQIAEYHSRVRTMRNHANNTLLALMKALEHRNREGIYFVEREKYKKTFEELIEGCNEDAECVAEKMAHPDTDMRNIFEENFAMVTQIFENVPYMHVLEINAIYQLVQLLYLEAFYGQSRLENREFKVFHQKQRNALKLINENNALTKDEKRLNRAVIQNTANHMKKAILERKFDRGEEFAKMAKDLNEENMKIYDELKKLRESYPGKFRNLTKKKSCGGIFKKNRKKCEIRNFVAGAFINVSQGKMPFLNGKAKELPKGFFDPIKPAE